METPEWSIRPIEMYQTQDKRCGKGMNLGKRTKQTMDKHQREHGTTKAIMPIYDLLVVIEAYVWSWQKINRNTGEWELGDIQCTREEKHKAKRSWATL